SHKQPVASVYEHDVVQYDKVPGLFRQIVDDLGGLDLIVYASGVMLPTGEDEYNFQKDLQIVEVNLLGCMAWLDEAATMFQRQASGAILAISSVAGDRGRKKYPAYHTAKAGVTTFVESLRNRLTPLGVRVLTVKPGPVDTAMTAGMKMPFMIGAPQAAGTMLQWLQRPWLQTLYVAYRWWAIMTVIRLLPSFIMRRLNF
ncbi:MAG: SDR family NAD(P)-dependent oxidoreductase, partial [Candidatus Methylomirabilis sp.]|nr:SDR family NAD(P)-dependent oxidoreductase [Deltaproteobacteria bacterium]